MDISRLLESLRTHKVKFLVIGAWALPAYTQPRMTKDIDIFIEPTEANARRTLKALKHAGYDVEDLDIQTLLKKKVLFRQYFPEADIHPFVTGVSFQEVWKRKKRVELNGCKVWVPSLDDLLKMKVAAGRTKDKLDVEVLKEVKKQLRKRTQGKQH
ncbi:MAG: nucleotidyltransferase [Bacteroidota bacterium]